MRDVAAAVPARRGRGQALVEFALVVPIFLLLLFGLIEVGRFIYLNNAFNEAAREGARYGSVDQWQYSCPAGVASPDRFSCTAQVARQRIAGAPAFFQVTVSCEAMETGGTTSVSAQACGPDDLLIVRVTTPLSGANAFHFLTPIIGQIIRAPVVSGQAQVVVQ
jgi:Flp pilus assembly protein TadG